MIERHLLHGPLLCLLAMRWLEVHRANKFVVAE